MSPQIKIGIQYLPQNLLHHGCKVGKRVLVVIIRKSVATNDAVKFCLCLLLDLGELKHGENEASQSRNSLSNLWSALFGLRWKLKIYCIGAAYERRVKNWLKEDVQTTPYRYTLFQLYSGS